jgi:hypothetical protein
MKKSSSRFQIGSQQDCLLILPAARCILLLLYFPPCNGETAMASPKLLQKTAELKKYLDLSYAYAQTLKPKPTTKKKKP